VKSGLFLCAAFCILCTSAYAGWVDLSANIPWPNDSIDLHDVQFFGEEGWVLGSIAAYPTDSGYVFHTTDGGRTFEAKRLPYRANATHWTSRQEAYIACQNGRVMRTTDGGDSWVLVGTCGSAAYALTFPPTGDTGAVCGYGGMAKRVTASGLISTPTGLNSNMHSVSFPVNAADGWMCGGTMIVHYYGGEWHIDQAYPSAAYTALFFVNNSRGWCVGDYGIIIRTRGDGINWDQQLMYDTSLESVHFCDTLRGWAAGNSGVILSTTDGGLNWQREPTGSLTRELLIKVFAVDTGTVYVVGNRKTFLKYTSAGGVEETMNDERGTLNVGPTIARGVLEHGRLGHDPDSRSGIGSCPAHLLDISGRKVRDLRPGPNDVSRLAPGVYFVSVRSTVGGRRSADAVRKIVIQR
jgi:photosystem II stability/assembly factor-like uncharacterized protein